MNNDSTIGQLKSLKLFGMAKRYEAELSLPVHQREDAQTLLGMLAQAETEHRNTKRTERYLKASKLRYNALPEEIECSVERGISRDQFIGLLDGSYIEAGGNVLISGATGVGNVNYTIM